MTPKQRRRTLLAGLLALVMLGGGLAEAQKNVPPGSRGPKLFRLYAGGTYAATATVNGAAVSGQTVGFTQLTGNFTLQVQHQVDLGGTVTGSFSIAATNGEQIYGTYSGTASALSYGYITLTGTWTVVGGSGKYLGCSGEGTLSGVMKPLVTGSEDSSGIVQITMTGDVNLETT